MCGDEPPEISNTTCPIRDLENFDSLKGVVATVLIGSRMGITIPPKGPTSNIFITEDGKRARTINEIAETLSKLILPS